MPEEPLSAPSHNDVEPISHESDAPATHDEFSDEIDINKSLKPDPPTGKKKRFNLTKKQKIILICTGIAMLLGIAGTTWWWAHQKPKNTAQNLHSTKYVAPAPTTVPSKLTGLPVAPDVNNKQVTAVMIENSPDARPQSGLKDAGVIFEAIAEGGVTRFMALFQDTSSAYIGPVRSARPYYLEWLLPFDAALAHVGGSPDALAAIKTLGVKDLDQFANGDQYQRITSRYAPHNAYTSSANLATIEQRKGYNSSNYTGFVRKPKETPATQPTVTKIDLNISGYLYNPHWDYDKASNSYKRSEGGAPHVDEKTNQQLTAKVIVVLVMNQATMSDGYHTAYTTTGSGSMIVFQDGTSQNGTWSKSDTKSQFSFVDANNKPLALDPGQTWVTIVGSAAAIAAKP